MNHYHIRWGNSNLDWEVFQTEEEAKAAAEQLKRAGENYVVEKFDANCQRCKTIKAKASARIQSDPQKNFLSSGEPDSEIRR